MKFERTITLKNGKQLYMRNASYQDGEEVLDVFNRTHAETDYLLTYPDENQFNAQTEADFLEKTKDSDQAVEILAFVDGKLTGSAGIEPVGSKYKTAHRAEYGISILKEFWGYGIGRALTDACIECARTAGFEQLELCVVGENERAVAMYKNAGFEEFGRNPRGFRSRTSGYQEVVHMMLAL